MRAEGFSCSLDVLYGGLGISKLQFLIKKRYKTNFQLYIFLLQFLVIKTLDPYPDPDSLEMLDLDPYPDPHYWLSVNLIKVKCGKFVPLF